MCLTSALGSLGLRSALIHSLFFGTQTHWPRKQSPIVFKPPLSHNRDGVVKGIGLRSPDLSHFLNTQWLLLMDDSVTTDLKVTQVQSQFIGRWNQPWDAELYKIKHRSCSFSGSYSRVLLIVFCAVTAKCISCMPSFPFIVFCQHKWTLSCKTGITTRIKCRRFRLRHISLHHCVFVTVRAAVVNLAACQLEVAGKLGCYGWEALVHLHTHSHTLEMADERFSKSSKAVCLSSACPCPFRSIPPSVKQSPPMETGTLSRITLYFTVSCNTFWVFINKELKVFTVDVNHPTFLGQFFVLCTGIFFCNSHSL